MAARIALALLVSAVLASIAPSSAEEATAASRAQEAPRAELTADEIIARCVEARGGLAKLRAIDTLVYSRGLYREADWEGNGQAFMAFARPYFKVVGNPESPGGFMEGYDGAAWEWFADPGIVIRTVGAAAGASRRGTDFEGSLVDYRAKGSTVELGPMEEIDGRPAHRLRLTTMDGFARDYLIDAATYLIVAERRVAPFHAYGEAVTSETRVGDYRPVAGVLFAHSYVQTDIESGAMLSRMQWRSIEGDRDLPPRWFSPPQFERTPVQRFLENLYGERTDPAAVLWTYEEFRRAHPDVDTRAGVELIGYQMLKMGEVAQATALLEANLRDHPDSADAAFGLARAYRAGGDLAAARRQLEAALRLDPDHRRARRELEALREDAGLGGG